MHSLAEAAISVSTTENSNCGPVLSSAAAAASSNGNNSRDLLSKDTSNAQAADDLPLTGTPLLVSALTELSQQSSTKKPLKTTRHFQYSEHLLGNYQKPLDQENAPGNYFNNAESSPGAKNDLSNMSMLVYHSEQSRGASDGFSGGNASSSYAQPNTLNLSGPHNQTNRIDLQLYVPNITESNNAEEAQRYQNYIMQAKEAGQNGNCQHDPSVFMHIPNIQAISHTPHSSVEGYHTQVFHGNINGNMHAAYSTANQQDIRHQSPGRGPPSKRANKRAESEPCEVYPCTEPGCGKTFARFYNLKSHEKTHSGEKAYKCNMCDGAFSRSHDLKRHQRIHTGLKPYTCDKCQKTFSRLDALSRHRSTACQNRFMKNPLAASSKEAQDHSKTLQMHASNMNTSYNLYVPTNIVQVTPPPLSYNTTPSPAALQTPAPNMNNADTKSP